MIYSILLVVWTTLAFGLHGGELATGINRQVRNLLCAIPFGLTTYFCSSQHWGFPLAVAAFMLAYGGVSLGFAADQSNPLKLNYPRLVLKGLITCPVGGGIALPLVYFLSYKTRYTNILAEYGSGAAFGLILLLMGLIYGT